MRVVSLLFPKVTQLGLVIGTEVTIALALLRSVIPLQAHACHSQQWVGTLPRQCLLATHPLRFCFKLMIKNTSD